MKLIVVESPSKAKTLKGYLSSEYEVIASVGHFRDLPKSGLSIDEKDDFNVKRWEIDTEKINPVLKLIKKANEVLLAPDPDREGELIAWHLLEICKEKKLLEGKKFIRIEFNQINKDTVLNAIKNPRNININLVNAAIARRFLDRFFGYKISPITQRRTIFGKSAGRVQSPALRILANREMEIDKFKPEEFWEIIIFLKTKSNKLINFKLSKENNEKISKLSIKTEKKALEIIEKIKNANYKIETIEKKEKRRKPYPPFSGSTLQQDASSKLNFDPKFTNQIAQQLYDGSAYKELGEGLITYPRSDSVSLSDSLIKICRELITKSYSKEYLPHSPNIFKKKTKFAQEAHQPITPTNLSLTPDKINGKLNDNQFKLYNLIWRRTVASQMSASINLETSIKVKCGNFILVASGTIPIFDGYKKVYNFLESENVEKKDEIPNIKKEDNLNLGKIEKMKHFTSPPNRFSQAGLIKKLEELGIGRPSTYASIIEKLKEKNYVNIKNKSMIPNAKGKILSKFLENFFNEFVEYEFTAELEKKLDLITKKEADWKEVLKNFLNILNKTVGNVEKKSITNVIDLITEKSEELLSERKCPKCKDGDLTIKFAFTGPFIGCSKYSKEENGCKFSNSLDDQESNNQLIDGEKVLGIHPEFQKEIKIKRGRYGLYLETEISNNKIKRTAIPKNFSIPDLGLNKAVDLLRLPREIGVHPDTNLPIIASIGPFGPYIKHDSKTSPVYVNLKDDDVLFIGLNRAIELIIKKEELNKGIEIGINPKSNEKILLKKGKFGYFFEVENESNQKNRVSIPRKISVENMSLNEAIEIINAKKTQKKTKKKVNKTK